MQTITDNASKKVIHIIRNTQGREVMTLETSLDRATLVAMLSIYEWGARIARHISERDEETGCIVWTGSKTKKGYGQVGYKRQTVRTHRLVYQAIKGITVGSVMHLCNNPICLNPDHLKAGTNAENTAYRDLCGNTLSGTDNPACRYTTQTIIEVRKLILKGGMTQQKIAQMCGVSRSYVSYLKNERYRSDALVEKTGPSTTKSGRRKTIKK